MRVVSLNLSVEELLHVVVLFASETQLLCLVPCPLVLDDSEAAHDVDRPTLVDVQAVLLVVALHQLQDPGKHRLALHLLEHRDEVLPFYRQTRVELGLRIETVH